MTPPAATRDERRRPPTVRGRLLLMAASLIAPAALFMILLLQTEYRESRQRYEAQLVATTRALSLTTDREIAQGQAILRGLSMSPALEARDFAAFEDQARRTIAGEPGWIVFSDRTGQQIFNTRNPRGLALPRGELPATTWAALESGQPVVSNLVFGVVAKGPVVAIDKPVVLGGVVYALSYIQEPAAFASIFQRQQLPDAWVGSIIDRNGRVIARSRDLAQMVGRSATDDMKQAMARQAEGVVLTHTLDGVPTLSAWSRSPSYGWTFIVGVPRAELRAISTRAMAVMAASLVLLLGAGALFAVLFSKRISREVRSLMEDARHIEEGGLVEPRRRDLLETSQVRRALQTLSIALRDREEERTSASNRQRLMINELNHRVKNTLATVQSLALQSLGRDRGDRRIAAFNDRLMALSRAHDLLTRHTWEKAELGELIGRTLEPYGRRAQLGGPPVWLSPNAAVTLSMVFHELATNAAKYGALSGEAGEVSVTWTLQAGRLDLVWREAGGPPAAPPAATGFGSRLITSSLAALEGSAELDYRTEGLVCRMEAPLSDQVWTASAQVAAAE